MKEPLVRLPAAKGRPVSTADLVAQNVVSLVSEAIKKIQEKKEQDIDEQQDFDEPLYEETFDEDDDMLEEADDTPAKVEDKIEQI
jgi:dephospho-CoA kinase